MVTTIQVEERTLDILKKIKEETSSSSYDEAINRLVILRLGKGFSGWLFGQNAAQQYS